MCCTLILILVAVGFWPLQSTQYAYSVGLQQDGFRVRYASIKYIDGVTCAVTKDPTVMFDDVANAITAWNRSLTHGARPASRWKLMFQEDPQPCYGLIQPDTLYELSTIMAILAVVICVGEIRCLGRCCGHCFCCTSQMRSFTEGHYYPTNLNRVVPATAHQLDPS